jgi:hypothetical protein
MRLAFARRLLRPPPRWLALALLCAASLIAYVFYASAGLWWPWKTHSSFYDQLAEGFRAGHLYLSVAPPPALVAQANPFQASNRPLWLWDASLYGGHYYMYWGPLPALLLAAVKTIFRMSRAIGDQYVMVALAAGQLVAGVVLVARMARRLFPGLPPILVGAAALVFACANPMPFMLGRAAVYEGAIVGGQAFLLLGLVLAFDAIWDGEQARRPSRARLAAAGVAWAAALACRASLAPAVALLVLATGGLAPCPPEGRWRARLGAALAVGLPVAAAVMALLAYNRARFGAWLEFGLGYQLTTIQLLKGARYLPANVYSYAFRPMETSCHFQFVKAVWEMGARAFPRWLHPPRDYWIHEPLIGASGSIAWGWLSLGAALPVGRAARATWTVRAPGPSLDDRRARGLLWCAAALAIAATAGILPALTFFTSTMRYLGDAAPGIVLLGTLGAWSLVDELGRWRWPRRAAVLLCLLLAAHTVAVGLLLGFQGYHQAIRWQNPALWQRLTAISICR